MLGARGIERWQWLLRLDPAAGLEPQIAALFLDVERLAHLPSAHRVGVAAACQDDALRGTWVAEELLADLGVSLVSRVRVQQLIRDCNGPHGSDSSGAAGVSCELRLLREADTLSDPLLPTPSARGRSAPLPAGTAAAHPDPLADRVIGPSGVLRAIDALGRGRRLPSPATVMARSRLAVGMLGGAGLAPTRLAPLLARAEALGALGAPPADR
jgi:hypothetical protein